MDNSNSLTSTILKPSEPIQFNSATSVTNSSGTNSGFFDTLKNINMTTWILIIFILSFLGFNIFVYLAKGTQDITNFFAPLLEKIFGTTVAVTSETVDVAAEGAKAVVSGTAGTINTGLTAIQDITPTSTYNSPLNKALNDSKSQQSKDYEGQEASSSLKSGWCFIGEDRGFRSCSKVNEDDKCMSGDIFPSQELCMNPNLRI